MYRHLTVDDLPEPPGWCPPIPNADDHVALPVVDPSPEPLVDAADRFLWVNAYQPVHPGVAPGRLWVRATAADRLARAQAALPDGYGLAVFDAWRPLALQQALYDDAYNTDPDLPEGFLAPPSTDPAFPPPHLTGGTVDVTLTWRGRPLALGTAFDDFTDSAHTAALEPAAGRARGLRRLLHWCLTNHSFVNHPDEWWHWEWGTGIWAAAVGHPPLYGPAAPGS